MEPVFDYNESAVVKCSNCGADMLYDPSIGALKCPYCSATRDVVKRVPSRRDFLQERMSGGVAFDGEVYKCPNCGGEMELSSFETANECLFCGSTNIIKLEDMKGMKPDSILPFVLDQKSAAEAGKRWIKRKLYAPHSLKKSFSVDKFKGVYVPSFAFTTNSTSSYSGRFGERRTRTVGTGKNRRTEYYTYYYNVSGTYNQDFVDVSVEASTHLDQKELNKILPYDMHNAEGYTREYVAGFNAERYDTSLDESFDTAKNQMDASIRQNIISMYKADVIDYLNVSTSYNNVAFRYTLLPLWVCKYKHKEKLYRFLVNGRTGKSTGKTPISPLKVIFTVLIALGLIALFVWLAYSDAFI